MADQTAKGAGLDMNAMLIEAAPGENVEAAPQARAGNSELPQTAWL